MEIKKEDLVKIRLFDGRQYVAIRKDFLDEDKGEIIVEVVKEPEPVPVPLTEEEVLAIAKEEKIAKLKAELKELDIPEV